MTSNKKNLIYLTSAFVLLLGFQNCSQGFQATTEYSKVLSSASSTPGGTTGSTPSTPIATTTTVPTSSGGGVVPNSPSDPSDQGRRILTVCASGCDYTLPSQAVAVAQDTDIINVGAGNYDDCFFINQNGLKLRGVNGRAHLTGRTCGGKGEIVIAGSDTVIENFEFSGAAVADRNGAGIRHQGLGLIVRNSYFHDNENGILSGRGDATPDPKDVILVENSRFEHNGGDTGHSHAIYLGAHAQATIRNNEFLASRDQGHEFKCRAANVTLECNYLGSLDGFDSFTLNFPDAGNVTVKNSVVEQGTAGSNSGIVDYGSEMLNHHPVNTLNFDNVAFINDLDRGTFFIVKNSTQFGIANSSIVGPGTMYSMQTATESNVMKYSSRSAAGYPAYPTFPKPAACTGTIGLLN